MDLKIAISTCPNDIFIFYALISNKFKTNYKFNFDFFDIEELNLNSKSGYYDIIKISVSQFTKIFDKYIILDSGSALGKGCGPLIVSNKIKTINELLEKRIGIPGENTTANKLFDIFVNFPVKKIFMRFDNIMPEIKKGTIDAGVIIHEGRFTYMKYGLNKIADLGELWEKTKGLPIPLGVIVGRKDIDKKILKEIDNLIKKSIIFAENNYEAIKDFIKKYAQEMDEKTIKSHIDLYVNNFTYSLGEEGREAIVKFLGLTGKKIFLER